jgi:hypothetical protein
MAKTRKGMNVTMPTTRGKSRVVTMTVSINMIAFIPHYKIVQSFCQVNRLASYPLGKQGGPFLSLPYLKQKENTMGKTAYAIAGMLVALTIFAGVCLSQELKDQAKSARSVLSNSRDTILNFLLFIGHIFCWPKAPWLSVRICRPTLLLILRTFAKKVAVKIIKGNAQTGGV